MNAQGAPPAKKVSVVVPVYNTEAFLVDCLDSLVNQTLDEIEIVVVNDGSPDDSQAIIDDYAARFPDKIVALSQPNGGLGSARNLGIAHATGRYVGFVDSDDFVELDMYRHLYEEAERTDSDVAICRYRHYALDGSYSVVGGNFPFAEGDVFPTEGFFLNSRVMIVVNKIYRTELVRQVPFQDTWFEDVAWSPVAMSHATRICYTPNIYYHYIMREGTITTSPDDARTLQEVSSLRWALANANPERADQVAYMAARRLLFDAEARPAYADKFALAVYELRDVIGGSQHVLDDPALYLAVRPYLDPDFTTIPKTILYSGSGRPGDEWKDRLAFEVDATYIDTDDLVAAPDDKIEPLLAARPAVLRDYLTLDYLATHGGVVLGDRPTILAPIAWALASSRSFFGFKDPTTVSRELFGAVAGAPVVADLLTLFVEHLDDADPLAAAVDEYFLGSGRVAWDYPSIEADFDEPYAELDDSCRVYATSVFSNDFGLGLATASLLPLAVSGVDGARYETTQAYQDIARRIALDYAKWFSTQKKPRPPAAARRTIPAEPPAEAPAAEEPAPEPTPAPPQPGLRRRLASALFGRRKDPEPEARQPEPPAPPRPEPRPLVVRGDAMRVLLYVGGFTTATSAERARLVASWLRDAHGPGVDISVLFTSRTSAAPAARAHALTAEGITVVTRTKPPAGAPEDQEWARVLGGAHFDLLLVATPKGGLAEASLLAAAPTGTRVLCLLGQDLPEPVRDSFDVVLDKLSEFRTWVDDQASRI